MTTDPSLQPEHWSGETRRLADQLMTRRINQDLQAHLAIAVELAELRKVLTPTETVELRPTGRLGQYVEAIESRLSELHTDESVSADLLPQEHETSGFALHRAMREEDRTHLDLMAITGHGATIKQVGWYCAGGHVVVFEGHDVAVKDEKAKPNLRFDDPCEHGVPVYVLVKP